MVPALLFLLFSRSGTAPAAPQYAPNGMPAAPQPGRAGMFRRVKVSTLLMTALCTVLIMPLVTVLNALSLFFTDNALVAIEGDVLNVPFPVMFFLMGMFGPFCEEFVFRGLIYGSYANAGSAAGAGPESAGSSAVRRSGWGPILLSAVTFGLMHMNFNQAVYAFGIGIFLAFLVEAAGSLWTSVFCHMLFNSFQVLMMYLSKALLGDAYAESVGKAAQEMTSVQLQAGLAVYLIIASVTTPIAVCCMIWIAKNEGRQERMRVLFQRQNGSAAVQPPQMPIDRQQAPRTPVTGQPPRAEYLLTTPLIVAIVLCLGYMSLQWILFL